MTVKRRRATREERLTPCECCGFPLSHRHHLLPVCDFDENDCTAALCGSCHDMFHVIDNGSRPNANKQVVLLYGELVQRLGLNNERLMTLFRLVKEAQRLHKTKMKEVFDEVERQKKAWEVIKPF